MIRSDTGDHGATIELTPIIDMVFLLLIFFLVATTFHQTELEMQIVLPQAQTAGPISRELREIVINVDADGAIVVSGSQMDPESLRQFVEDAISKNPNQKVSVRGDEATAYGAIARVLDVCKQAGIQEPFLDTVPFRGSGTGT